MSEETESGSLIDTRIAALLAACYAGILASWRISFLLADGDPRPAWIHSFDGVVPQLTWVALHLLVYGAIVFCLIRIVRELAGVERVYCVLFLVDPLLHPLRQFLPMPVPAIAMWVQAFTNLAMFVLAVQLFCVIWLNRKKQLPQQGS